MRALLLAAGRGTRLRPLTDTVPKCLVRIRGRALLDYWLDLLFGCGEVDRLLINTHHLAAAVRYHVAASRWQDRIDITYEHILYGTAGTVYANRQWLGRGPYLVAHADNLTNFDLKAFVRRHHNRPSGCLMTMLAYRTNTATDCGIIWRNGDGVLTEFTEKPARPTGNLANAAVYIFDRPPILCGFDEFTADLSTEVLPHMIGRAYVVEHHGYHLDIGTPERLALANHDVMATNGRQIRPASKSSNA